MDKSEAIKYLKESLSEIPGLAKLHHDNPEYDVWCNTIKAVLEEVFGHNSSEYESFRTSGRQMHMRMPMMPDSVYQEDYIANLKSKETAILSIINKCEVLGIKKEEPIAKGAIPEAFIVHGGKSEARDKLYQFLSALGIKPLIINEEPREGRSVNEQVEHYSKQADCAIILGTADDKELKDGKLYPRRNAFIEIGIFQEKFSNRIIYLLEEGASLPSDISEKLYTPFTRQCMDEAFITVVRELRKFGLIKSAKTGK